MKRFRRPLLLGASTLLHAGALGVALIVAGAGAPTPLFVDLTREEDGAAVPDTQASGRRGAAVPGAQVARAPKAALPSAPQRLSSGVAPQGSTVRGSPSGGDPPSVEEVAQERASDPPAPAPPTQVAAATPSAVEEVAPVPTAAPAPSPPAAGGRSASGDAGASRTAHQAGVVADSGVGTSTSAAGARSSSDVGPAGSGGFGGSGSQVALATGEGRGAIPPEYGPYLRRFRERVQESLRYPLAARRQRLGGSVELEVLMEPSGRVRGVQVISSSPHALLDEAALEAVRSLPPIPLPEHLPRRPLRIRLPLVFELR